MILNLQIVVIPLKVEGVCCLRMQTERLQSSARGSLRVSESTTLLWRSIRMRRKPPSYSYHRITQIRKKIIQAGSQYEQSFPWRNPTAKWHGLLSEVLLQRTKANNVIPVYNTMVENYPEPMNLAECKPEELESILYSLGFKWRAKFVRALGVELAKLKSTPTNMTDLLLLPGVGQYAASAFLAFHTEKRAILIDSNTARFVCRYTGNKYHGEVRREKWLIELIDRITPRNRSKFFNRSFLDFSMVTCKPSKPLCEQCTFQYYHCLYPIKITEVLEP